MSYMSGVLIDRRIGRLAIALAATALVGGGLLGSAGTALADDIHNVGSDGQDANVTCTTPESRAGGVLVCNAVGGNGSPGAVY